MDRRFEMFRVWYYADAMRNYQKWLPYVIILVAFAVRGWQLTAVPPGLTHDEAGHGHDAAYILKGVTLIYFTVGYGREPLFDYLNAGLIAGMGANPFTLRFSAVVISLLTLAATYKFGKVAFGRVTGWLGMAWMTAAFWPLATSRQILRSDLLPLEMAVAAICFLKVLGTEALRKRWLWALGLGLAVAASFYTYIPARLLWVMFPLVLGVGLLYRRWTEVRRAVLPVGMALAGAGLVAMPLVVYLVQHPDAEQRIGMLSQPVTALQGGDASVLLNNAKEFVLGLVVPGHGDHFLAYTIPGQALFDPATVVLALVGVWVVLVLAIKPPTERGFMAQLAAPLTLIWVGLGLAPSLVTGPEAMTTRIIGAQPILYLLPAIGLVQMLALLPKPQETGKAKGKGKPPAPRTSNIRVAVELIAIPFFMIVLAAFSYYNYFVLWAGSPDVRAAYQSTLVAMLSKLNEPSLVSTVNPSAPHDPYIGELLTTADTRWADARYAVVLRPSDATPLQLLLPASTPLHPFFQPFFQQRIKIALEPTDLDPYYNVYQPLPLKETEPEKANPTINGALELKAAQWLAASYKPGDVAELITGWVVLDASRLGEVHPPAFKTELNLFTHILNGDGSILLQQDRLDAPSWDWQAGDTILQIHQFNVASDTKAGQYAAEVGFYDAVTGERLPVTDSEATTLSVPPLIIQP